MNGEFHKALGQIITKKRKEQRYSQELLAENCGIHPTSMSNIETGRTSAKIDTLLKITTFLKIKLSDVVQEAEELLTKS